MESSSTPPRHICRKCGIKIKSTRNYCETCEDEPECPLCNRLTHQIGSICDDCLDYDISIDAPPTTPPLPPKKRYRSSFKGNTNNDNYIIKYPKNNNNNNNNNNQSDEDDKISENDSDTNNEKIERNKRNIRNKRNDKNKKSKITKKSTIYNTDSNKDKFLDEDEIIIRNSINNRVDTLDKLLGINTNDINDDDNNDKKKSKNNKNNKNNKTKNNKNKNNKNNKHFNDINNNDGDTEDNDLDDSGRKGSIILHISTKNPININDDDEDVDNNDIDNYNDDDNDDDNNDNDNNNDNKSSNINNYPSSNPIFNILDEIMNNRKRISNMPSITNREKIEKTLEDPPDNEEDLSSYPYEYIGKPNSITDLINLGKQYKNKLREKKRYSLNIKKLHKLIGPLEELQTMIGLEGIKHDIYKQIVYNLLELDDKAKDMWHTVIEGSPGVGKTEIANILAKVYNAFGITKTSKVCSLKRDDLIAGYVGQTALKAREKFNKAKGGVLLLDEAYSLGDKDGKDTFAQQMLDLLNAFLSENPDTVCIVTGYKKALQEQFFAANEGLKRRFSKWFEIGNYSPEDLRLILFKIIKSHSWSYEDQETILLDFFEKNQKYFIFNGGDMLNLFGCAKKSHAMRLLEIEEEDVLNKSRKVISYQDIKDGMELFLKNPEVADRIDNKKDIPSFYM